MKILQLVHGYPPEQAGGTEQYTAGLVHALAARGHEVAVIAREADWQQPEYGVRHTVVDGIPVFRVNNTWRACKSFEESYRHPGMALSCARLIEWWAPDVVHLQHLVHLSTELPAWCRARGIPVVMTFHDYWFLCNQGQLLRQDLSICPERGEGRCTDCAGTWLRVGENTRRVASLLERWSPTLRYRASRLRSTARQVLRRLPQTEEAREALAARMRGRSDAMRAVAEQIDVGLVPSQTLLDELLAFGIAKERLRHLPYGIPTAPYAGLPWAPERPLRVGYFGRVIPAKGVHVLLEAAKWLGGAPVQIMLHGEMPPFGDVDEYAARMRRLAARTPHITWAGAYEHDELPEHLAATDVVVAPSIWYENQPLVILEALTAGRPVIATDLGGLRELVQHEANGWLFPRGDARVLASLLRRAAEEPAELSRLHQGTAVAPEIRVQAEVIETLYRELMHRMQRPLAAVAVRS